MTPPARKATGKASAKASVVSDIETENARTRAELAATLDAIEAKMNPKAQAKRLGDAVKRRFDGSSDENAGGDTIEGDAGTAGHDRTAAAAKGAASFLVGLARSSRKKN